MRRFEESIKLERALRRAAKLPIQQVQRDEQQIPCFKLAKATVNINCASICVSFALRAREKRRRQTKCEKSPKALVVQVSPSRVVEIVRRNAFDDEINIEFANEGALNSLYQPITSSEMSKSLR